MIFQRIRRGHHSLQAGKRIKGDGGRWRDLPTSVGRLVRCHTSIYTAPPAAQRAPVFAPVPSRRPRASQAMVSRVCLCVVRSHCTAPLPRHTAPSFSALLLWVVWAHTRSIQTQPTSGARKPRTLVSASRSTFRSVKFMIVSCRLTTSSPHVFATSIFARVSSSSSRDIFNCTPRKPPGVNQYAAASHKHVRSAAGRRYAWRGKAQATFRSGRESHLGLAHSLAHHHERPPLVARSVPRRARGRELLLVSEPPDAFCKPRYLGVLFCHGPSVQLQLLRQSLDLLRLGLVVPL